MVEVELVATVVTEEDGVVMEEVMEEVTEEDGVVMEEVVEEVTEEVVVVVVVVGKSNHSFLSRMTQHTQF